MTSTYGPADLPSITRLLEREEVVAAIRGHGHALVVEALRAAVNDARARVLIGDAAPPPADLAAAALVALEERRRGCTQRVVNATGVVLHTNLGRAPLSSAAADAMYDAAGYVALEYDLAAGTRGRRGTYLAAMLARVTGAEAATVANNGAGALVLALAALASGRETVVSRGELIEIGGSFRLPEIMAASGTRLREVGTTNRTRAVDYADAVGDETALVLQVHPSNYRVVGFAQRPTVPELGVVTRQARVPLLVDIGSGLLDRDDGFADEPVAADVLADGADLVVFSGDKLLGGPQAGVIAGTATLVERCRRHPLARALRVDKFRLAALETTLDEHAAGTPPPSRAMIATPTATLRRRAEVLASRTGGDVIEVSSVTGGGSVPGTELASAGVRLPGRADTVLAALREHTPPVIGRIVDDRVVLDARTLAPDDEDVVVEAVERLRRDGLLTDASNAAP